MPKRTYVDACLIIAAFKGKDELSDRALKILEDRERTLVVSDAVWLEVMPKPLFHKQDQEAEFYSTIFDAAETETIRWSTEALDRARDLAQAHGIAAMDAIHVATALNAGVDEFATAEKRTKPMFRVDGVDMVSIRG